MNRRDFTRMMAGAWPGLALPAGLAKPRLKITDVRVVPLRVVKEVGSLEPAWSKGGRMEFRIGGGSITEVHTGDGLVGIGPGMSRDLVPAVKAHLVGQDPFDTETHAARLNYHAAGSGYSGSAGVDIALWDLIGKAAGQPLYKLWGGAKEKVTAYASMVQLSTPEERAALAARLAAEGWKAIKLRLHHETVREDLRTVELVRKAAGDRMVIMTDANQAQSNWNWQPGVLWDFRRAVETARELERMGVCWLEEPLPRFYFDQLAELNRRVEIPIAGGENSRQYHEFRQMLEQGVYDILQPESMVAGGVTMLRKIGALAEAFGRSVVPHHGGRQLGTIAHLHLVCSWRHAPYFEMLHDPPAGLYQNDFAIFENPPALDREGDIGVPQEPGLGVRVKADLMAGGA